MSDEPLRQGVGRQPGRPALRLTVAVDNYYDGVAVRSVAWIDVPEPPGGDLQDEHWVDAHIFPLTGTGASAEESKNAAYFVQVVTTNRPDLAPVGTTWEFGL